MTTNFVSNLEINNVSYPIQGSGVTTYSSTGTLAISGTGVASALSSYTPGVNVLTSSGTVALTDNSVNTITPTGNVTFTLPTVTDNTVFHQILVQVNLSTAYTFDVGTTYYFNKTAPDLSTAGVYNLIFEYDKANQYWVCGIVNKGAAS